MTVKHILFTFLLFSFSVWLTAQERIKKYVKENAVNIRSVAPDATDYSDLEPIGTAIGNARIVMLGEQDHGDAPAFLAKTRLIKYLHEKKGFHVLAFESDFFSLNYGFDKLDKKTEPIDSFLQKNIFGIWSLCDACRDLLYNYIPGTYRSGMPLQVSGFDDQQKSLYSATRLTQELDKICRQLSLPIIELPAYQSEILPLIDTITKSYDIPTDKESVRKRKECLELIKTQLIEKTGTDNIWVPILNNLLAANIQYTNKASRESLNIRDMQMAENLKWLARTRFPNEKIIVWAHNYHISKYNGHFKDAGMNKDKTMGSVFTSDPILEKETYVIGFTSFQGMAGRINNRRYTVPNPGKNNIELSFNPAFSYSFVDFHNYNQDSLHPAESFLMKASFKSAHDTSEGFWTKVFDGLFFIRDMFPCNIAN